MSTFTAPRGMRDFYPTDMAVRNAIFGAWRSAALAFGFEQYDACVVESLELLKRKAGEEIVDQIYSFQDKSGRDLALRPEMTPTLARMVAARESSLVMPLKWFAISQCFRYERMSRGRKREHYQWNLDVVAEPSARAEVEVIACALHALSLLGIEDEGVRVHFSSRALLSDLLNRLGIDRRLHGAAFLALDKASKVDRGAIETMLRDAGLVAGEVVGVLKLLDLDTLDAVAGLLAREQESYQRVETFMRAAESSGIDRRLRFDISVVRGLAYYTGIVFEGFDAGRELRALFGGGRYDNLLGDVGGSSATAVGLGFGDVVVAELLADRQLEPGRDGPALTAVGYMDEAQADAASRLARALRARGVNVDMALSAEKAKRFFARVVKSGCAEAIYVGPDDVQRGRVRVKSLADRVERELSIADLTAPH